MFTNGVKHDTRILIIGGGLGGLTLAQALRKNQIPYMVFERDEGATSRGQGWAIALHAIIGELTRSIPHDLPPLSETAVTYGLGRGASYASRAAFFDAYTAERKIGIGGDLGDPRYSIRASRVRIREWLATNLDVQWNKRFVRYEKTEKGVTAFFADGTSFTREMLVGCEGINSYVRTQLFSPNPPQLNQVCSGTIFGNVVLTKAQYEAQLENARSFYFILGKGWRMLIGLVWVAEDKETAYYYWVINWPDPEAGSPDFWALKVPPAERLTFVLKKMEGVDEHFTCLVKATKVEDMAAPLAIKDLIPSEISRGRVTLLGDASHPMTPFRGEGANNALQDGLNLAKIINAEIARTEGLTGEKWDVPSLLKIYEGERLERNTKSVKGSRLSALDVTGGLGMSALSSWNSKNKT